MTRSRIVLAGVLTATTLVLAACGEDSSGSSAPNQSPSSRTIEIRMEDTKFTPAELTVQEGDTVEFTFVNDGLVPHDASIGDSDAQADHEAEMASMGGMDHGTEPNAVTVEPGQTEVLSYTFNEAGTLEIGCHQPGHYAAGMKIQVAVQ